MNKKEYSVEVGEKTYTAIFSDLANQAHGSVMLKCGETVMMATAARSSEKSTTSWFNLTVDYLEKFYATGKILGGRYRKREGRPSDESILVGRVVDRTLRPLFDTNFEYGVQIMITVLAIDETVDTTTMAVNAASLALAVSEIPWNGPVGAVRLGEYKGQKHINVHESVRREGYDFDLTVCGKDGKLNMIESSAYQTKEEDISKSFEESLSFTTAFESWQKDIVKDMGKEKMSVTKPVIPEVVTQAFNNEMVPKLADAMFSEPGTPKSVRSAKTQELSRVWKKRLAELMPDENTKAAFEMLDHKMDDVLHDAAIDENKRSDGRDMVTVRPLYAQAGGVSTVLHGSGIFYRGGTHVLSTLTLGGPEDKELVENMEMQGERRFMHHYNFPPYSVGETGRGSFTSRREVGHGFLAQKALEVVLPDETEFPYTIRVVSESVASNGSTSQASICGMTLALMDGGVPIKAPVAGIAMGLMYRSENEYKVLTDIQGPEDHHGDMDFKAAGTRNGVTAIQMDVKLEGVTPKILIESLEAARVARMGILDVIEKEISSPRAEISASAPKILMTQINPEKIGMVIGGGGKTINEIREKTGTEITIEEDGRIFITGMGEGPAKAKDIIAMMTKEWKIGDEAKALIDSIKDFGAFAKLDEYTEGMIHISEIGGFRVEKVSEYLKEGDIVPVKIIKVENGKIGLSIKQADKDFIKQKES
jgi:polyribonucleotide nucleotidyltransferase